MIRFRFILSLQNDVKATSKRFEKCFDIQTVRFEKLFRKGGGIFALERKILDTYIQLFRERLSDKVHATSPKGIVGGFEFIVFQRNLKERQEGPWKFYVCEC